jgi:hypothetical protein
LRAGNGAHAAVTNAGTIPAIAIPLGETTTGGGTKDKYFHGSEFARASRHRHRDYGELPLMVFCRSRETNSSVLFNGAQLLNGVPNLNNSQRGLYVYAIGRPNKKIPSPAALCQISHISSSEIGFR